MTAIASLPMYDWPELREATDALWAAIRDQLERRNINAPAALQRGRDPEALWRDPHLLLSQTCGYPYATGLAESVTLVGTPAHAATGARAGHYFSVLVARADAGPATIMEAATKRFAFNMRSSQSGFAAPVRMLAATGCRTPAEPLETGSHRASIQAVAEGRAGWAAIDAVTWELAKRHEPAAQMLAVFARTPETPALPLITGPEYAAQAGIIAEAVEAAIEGLTSGVRKAALLTGLVRLTPQDYAPLAAALPLPEVLPRLAV